MDQHETESLRRAINRLERSMRKQVSFRHIFMRSVLWGVGTVLGASLVAGIVLTISFRLLSVAEYIPILNILPFEQTKDALYLNLNGNSGPTGQ